ELNRTPPKTQSALLEAMAEGHVTVDGRQYALPENFMVIATQNPVSFAGTYPLPEAQLDRFMMKLSIGYPSKDSELEMLRTKMEGENTKKAEPVLTPEDISECRAAVGKVHISDPMLEYMQNIVRATRENSDFLLGLSPRALIHLMQATRARAYLSGRDYVKPDDVRQIAVCVLAHRLVLTTEARLKKEDVTKLLNSVVLKIKIPVE
ncbi:MAG: MoxR family ATPase, partial [Lachnospiraceae bacterium]|nr:MoxR family ATPase [Lachnospiraceae bacterium]